MLGGVSSLTQQMVDSREGIEWGLDHSREIQFSALPLYLWHPPLLDTGVMDHLSDPVGHCLCSYDLQLVRCILRQKSPPIFAVSLSRAQSLSDASPVLGVQAPQRVETIFLVAANPDSI